MTHAVRLQGVGKRYTKYDDPPALTSSVRNLLRRTRRSTLWAVRDLDLEVPRGGSVGVIGANGSGKTTLLQLLCGVTAPSTGVVQVRGRTAPLIAVGVGFHPELSGRENIGVNGAILGMSRREVARKLDDIVAFSGVEAFLDTPVKFYSSGMAVRLGFAVAAHAEPDVLLVDEVLAVGDLAFQVKSFHAMERLRADGTTIVVVSHNLSAVQQLCPRSLVMESGRAVFDGSTSEAISAYHDVLARAEQPTGPGTVAQERDSVVVEDVALLDADRRPVTHVDAGDRLTVRVRLRATRGVDAPFALLRVDAVEGQHVYREYNLDAPFPPLRPGAAVTWEMGLSAALPTGSYAVRVAIARVAGHGLPLEEALSDIAVLASPGPRMLYVAGRPGVSGVADLQGSFLALPDEA